MTATVPASSAAPSGSARRHAAAAWAGILFVPLFVVGLIVGFDSPEIDEGDKVQIDWYSDSGNRWHQIIGMYLLLLAAIAFLAFATGLIDSLRGNDGPSALQRFAGTSAAICAALIIVSAIMAAGIAGNIELGDSPVPKDADVLRQNLGYVFLFVGAAMAAAALVAAVNLMTKGRNQFGTGLAVFNWIVVLGLALAIMFFPMVLLPIWVLVMSVFMLRRTG